MAEEATRFAARLNKQLGLPVDMIDERLSSWEAERLLEEQSGRVFHAAKRHSASEPDSGRTSVDAVAAAVILKEYLEQRDATKANPKHI
jgi:putative Holliday junction resolvase